MRNKFFTFVALLFASITAFASDYTYVAGEGLVKHWGQDDKASITTGKPNVLGEVMQRAFYVTDIDSNDPSYATINAPSFMLSANATYYSYVPYRWYDNFDPTAVLCNYDNQKQVGNDNAAGLSVNDVCVAKIETTSAAEYDIEYRHVGSVMRITMNAPASACFTQLNMSMEKKVIPHMGSLNLLTQQVEYSNFDNSMSLSLGNVSLVSGEQLIAYLMMPAVDLSDGEILITLTDENAKEYAMTPFTGPNIKPGMLYNVEFVDVDVVAKHKSPTTSVQSVEFPMAHFADIPVDASFDGRVNNVSTSMADRSISWKGNMRYAASGMIIGNNESGIVITKDADGKIKKQIIR